MSKAKHLELLKESVQAWNEHRRASGETVDLMGADLSGLDLAGADFEGGNLFRSSLGGVNLRGADLRGAHIVDSYLLDADLSEADLTGAVCLKSVLNSARLVGAALEGADFTDAILSGADLSGASIDPTTSFFMTNLSAARLPNQKLAGVSFTDAEFWETDLRGADLRDAGLVGCAFRGANLAGADLRGAKLARASLNGADLTGARLDGADLSAASLIRAKVEGSSFAGAKVYGISVWDLDGTPQSEADLVVTPEGMPAVTVSDLEVAQFVYLLIHNQKIRDVIDTVTTKTVLILGNFSEERLRVLQAMRTWLGQRDFVPVLFDFDKPTNQDITGTVETLARMARFIIADLTHPSSIPHELATVVPHLRKTPILSLRQAGTGGYSMFRDYQAYPWVLETHEYVDLDSLLDELPDVIAPATEKARELRGDG